MLGPLGPVRRVRGDIGKTASCATEIMDKWQELERPTVVSSTEFSQIAATYGPMGVQRARGRLGITATRLTDAGTGKVIGWEWRFPA